MRAKTKTRVKVAFAFVVGLILFSLVFVFRYMHAVYEAEEFIEADDLPLPVQNGFASRFPGSQAEWKFEDNLYEATFRWEEQDEVEAYFAPAGNLTKTESPIPLDQLPEQARRYIEGQDGLKYRDLQRIEQPGTNVTYEVELRSLLTEWDCIFDADGNLISNTRDGSTLEE